jgi:hypothetical protein
MSTDDSNDKAAQGLIPGAFERRPLTDRQPGAMGGSPFGAGNATAGPSSLTAATILEREKEGGGGASQRPRPVHKEPEPEA